MVVIKMLMGLPFFFMHSSGREGGEYTKLSRVLSVKICPLLPDSLVASPAVQLSRSVRV